MPVRQTTCLSGKPPDCPTWPVNHCQRISPTAQQPTMPIKVGAYSRTAPPQPVSACSLTVPTGSRCLTVDAYSLIAPSSFRCILRDSPTPAGWLLSVHTDRPTHTSLSFSLDVTVSISLNLSVLSVSSSVSPSVSLYR